jgi:RNA polymerase sigma-70 factor (ECF subfamily)
MLRSRRARREDFWDAHLPDPVVTFTGAADPEQEALLADSVGLAPLVVLEELSPAERLAFVLHDVFGVPFADIATALERSESAAMQLASRASRRRAPATSRARSRPRSRRRAPDRRRQAATRGVAQPPRRGGGRVPHDDVLETSPYVVPALVNGAAGAVIAPRGSLYAVMAFTVTHGRIAAIDALLDPERLERIALPT